MSISPEEPSERSGATAVPAATDAGPAGSTPAPAPAPVAPSKPSAPAWVHQALIRARLLAALARAAAIAAGLWIARGGVAIAAEARRQVRICEEAARAVLRDPKSHVRLWLAPQPGPATGRGLRLSQMLALAGAWAVGGATALILGFSIYVTWGMPSTDDLWTATDNPSLTFVDRHGRVILREDARSAPPVAIDQLPAYVPQAVIAIEDRRFYDHGGVDFNGLIRASLSNVRAGRVVQGGSTLTQQLAKNLFLTNNRTFRRKAQEIVLALWLEERFSKDQILALYLSRVYFGAGAWGIEAASERYFDKPISEVSLAEAALLAALLKAPSRLNPAAEDTAAKARAKIVLDAMVEMGFITAERREAALLAPLSISRANPTDNLGYFRNWIDANLNALIGGERDDYIIETTLDLTAQRAAERAVEEALSAEGEALNVSQAALLSLDAGGGVRAMVGGRGFGNSQFNRATQMRRQPGSAFKFFIYLTAMEEGVSPYSVREDAPLAIGDWAPGNYDNEYYGSIEVIRAFALSLNMVAIQLTREVGGGAVIDTARRLGVDSPLFNYRSLPLGAQELTLLELSRAYGAMASGGYRLEPHGIARIRRARDGEIIYARAIERERVIDGPALRLMNLMMKRVVDSGTARRARLEGRDVGGKTGTGNDYRDAWFMGFTPGVVTGVWVGNDDFAAMRRVTGGGLPAQIWHAFMSETVDAYPPTPMEMPRASDFPVIIDAVEALDPLDLGPISPPPLEDAGAQLQPLPELAPAVAPRPGRQGRSRRDSRG